MFRVRSVCLVLILACLLTLSGGVLAAEVDCDTTYCFTSADFSTSEQPLAGICITQLPDADSGTVMLGTRVLRKGDILTAEQVTQMTFAPLYTQTDTQACVSYLPIYENRVEEPATMTLAIRGKEDKAPVAQDSAVETYKNLPNEGKLRVADPEGKELTYTLVRAPKRGDVELRQDGTFCYTPKRNKVGVDSFVYTAADPAGNVSREATVTVQILKPSDAKQYADTMGSSCRFAAEWMRNTGLFEGEKISGQLCFGPEKTVTREQFTAMLVQMLDIPAENEDYTALSEDTPQWLRPYLAAALRSGLTAGLPESEESDAPITGAEAAVMLQNALDLTVAQEALETAAEDAQQDVPAWAASSLAVMADNGVELPASEALTRAQVAQVLYQASQLAVTAPGTAVFRLQN